MHIESVKLSPKKGGNGYVSSFSFSIGSKEAAACGLIGKRIIKIIDEDNGVISFKAKRFTANQHVVDEVIKLKKIEHLEDDEISDQYANKWEAPSGAVGYVWSYGDMIKMRLDEVSGKVVRPHRKKMEQFLLSLPVETLADIVLLMYLGRDYYVDMESEPGEERFLRYYDTYSYIVLGVDSTELVDRIMEKMPLVKYLETGMQLLKAPRGTDIDELLYGPREDEYD